LDAAAGWSPDGKRILFVSGRSSSTDPPKLFSVPLEGGYPSERPLPMASSGNNYLDKSSGLSHT